MAEHNYLTVRKKRFDLTSFLLLCFPVELQRPSTYQLWSSQSNQLTVPPVNLSTYGPRSFAVAGPTIWNNLPECLRDPELSIDTV